MLGQADRRFVQASVTPVGLEPDPSSVYRPYLLAAGIIDGHVGVIVGQRAPRPEEGSLRYQTPGGLSIFRGDGLGGFTEGPPNHSLGRQFQSLQLVDFDGDRILDVISDSEVAKSVAFGSNNGSFDGRIDFPMPTVPAGTTSALHVGDFSGDGKMDLSWAGYVCVAEGRKLLPSVAFRRELVTQSLERALSGNIDMQGGKDFVLSTGSWSPQGGTYSLSVLFVNPSGVHSW